MIYVTAQMVVSRKTRGINSYFYRRPGPAPVLSDLRIDITRALESPGELVDFETEITPGGNRVPAFMDLVAVDGVDLTDVRALMDEVADLLPSVPPPIVKSSSQVGVYFNTDFSLYSKAAITFDTLKQTLLRRLRNPPAAAMKDRTPFVVRVHTETDAIYYDLDEASFIKLQEHKGAAWFATPVRIEHQTRNDFERIIGNFIGQIGMLVTRLEEDELLRFGGVRYVDAASGVILGEWPSRRSSSVLPTRGSR